VGTEKCFGCHPGVSVIAEPERSLLPKKGHHSAPLFCGTERSLHTATTDSMNSEPSDHASLVSSPTTTALYHQAAQPRIGSPPASSPRANADDGLPVMEAAPPQNMSTAATTTTAASDEAVSQKLVETPLNARKPVDKRSLEYVSRSGLAGGIAGCAVSLDGHGQKKFGC
jgi:hypothetical protein